MQNRTSTATVRVVEPPQRKAQEPKRGSVGKAISKLLLTKPKMTYGDIAESVKGRIPGAATSARSVACIAHGLRAAGLEVPEHPRPPRG